MKSPVSTDEEARIAALQRYDILDTPNEQEYDDFTLLASEICDTPIALISFVDYDRQWFKSHQGLEVNETPRDVAFCSHAISDRATTPFIVRDALNDERFADNPLVINDPKIRFYAGAQLSTPDHHTLGTLCVIDRRPRDLSERQLAGLQALARQVMNRMELHRMTRLLERANKELRQLSLTDELTKLNNRRGFLTHAQHQLKLFYSRQIPVDLWLLMADMDDLKYINDNFGHIEGSDAIYQLAEILKTTFRDTDILARLGGDEFAGMIINAQGRAQQIILERLQQNILEYNNNSGKPYVISVSFGLIQIDSSEVMSVDELLDKVDLKMYEDKRRKRDSI